MQLMYACKGVGLAAPQVGVNKRLMVFNPGTVTAALCSHTVSRAYTSTVMPVLLVIGVAVPNNFTLSQRCMYTPALLELRLLRKGYYRSRLQRY
jgi:Polypeptide deformylase